MLMSPLWSLTVPCFDRALSWEDIHPAHRMSRVRDALQEAPRLQLVENVERDCVAFINELCGALEWPTPEQLVKIRVLALLNGEVAGGHAEPLL